MIIASHWARGRGEVRAAKANVAEAQCFGWFRRSPDKAQPRAAVAARGVTDQRPGAHVPRGSAATTRRCGLAA